MFERERERKREREGEIWVQLDLGMLVWVQVWNRLRKRILVSSLFYTTGGGTLYYHTAKFEPIKPF
jgi:hypothetical protein